MKDDRLDTAVKSELDRRRAAPSIVDDLSRLAMEGYRFQTILADPPWRYANTASRGAAENHYSTMTVEAICAEPVSQLVADNAHLHLWTTNGFLEPAFRVIRAWGFEYKSCLVWVKPNIGLGNYWRLSHEFLCDRSHKNSYVVKFVMWRSHVERLEMPRRRTWERHIIFASRGTIWTSFQSMHDKTAEPNSRDAAIGSAGWENYVVHPARTVPSSEMNARSPPHNQEHHIRIPPLRDSRTSAVWS